MEQPDPALVAALRADLEAAEYTVEHVEQLLGPVASGALAREQALPALTVTARNDTPLATLVRTFLLGRPTTSLDRALPRLGTDGAIKLGLVAPADEATEGAAPGARSLIAPEGGAFTDHVVPLLDLRPYAAHDEAGDIAWWIVSDPGELATGKPLRPDHVLGIGGASTTLAQVTIRSPRGRTLDLGTGCGVQALHAARHSEHVVATDISRRALRLTALNAALAGTSLDLRAGSMLDPVAGEEFDLVVSNPPFVITPRAAGMPAYEYRDGGRTGDAVVRDLVGSVRDVLAPGGVAQLLGNWEVPAGADWREVVGSWLDGSGLDGWIVQREVQDPAEYAETWLRDGGTTPERDPEGWQNSYAAWLEDFATRDVAQIGFGVITLRRPVRGAPTLRRLEEHHGPVQQPLGPVIARFLEAHDGLASADDDALRTARLRVAADVTEERHLVPGQADPSVVLLRQGGGFGRTVQVSTAAAGLVGACDGELTVGQIVAALGALLGRAEPDVAREVLPVVRGLVLDGMLVADSEVPD